MSTRSYRSKIAPYGMVIFLFVSFILYVQGCTGKSGMASPQRYGGVTEESTPQKKQDKQPSTTVTTKDTSSTTSYVGQKTTTTTIPEQSQATDTTPTVPKDLRSVLFSDDLPGNSDSSTSQANDSWYYGEVVDVDDSASAVDDELWRQLDLAEEYHAMGVLANREGSWEEAQYHFEKGLKILAALDIESDSLETPEAAKYTSILENIIADYRVTLRSQGRLQEDVSASVLLERFVDLEKRLGSDSLRIYGKQEQEITYNIPIVMNERVKRSIIYFQTVARDAFYKYLCRSRKYKPMMERILQEHGLPTDLVYLSLVESGYNPRAYSWARASGLWQFISSTGRLYGLKRSWWIDERRDPVKSTHAACRFLKDLYDEFGSWELAMAAYNGGPGRVRRTIKKHKTIDFWKLKLRRQTMDYVPLIMAATIIAKNPEKYGFYDIEYEDELIWDEVVINKCLELSVVAKAIGCSVKELQELNPELLRKYTPPNYKNYTLKIPKGLRNKFLAVYDSLPSPKETSWVKHKIRRGETISTIAARYGVSQYAIMEANNLRRRSTIYAGKTLIVPVPLNGKYSASRKRKSSDYEAKNSIYTVRAGDTMWDIARAFGTTVEALRRINYIQRGSRIYVGQKLKIPSDSRYFATKNKKKGRSGGKTYASTSSRSSPGSKQKTYKVRKGDTLWDIARKFGTTTSQIRRMNGLGRTSRIYPGQVLTVKGGSSPRYVIHKVRRGETLGKIARKYRTSVTRILQANKISNPDRLQVGKKLKIYMD